MCILLCDFLFAGPIYCQEESWPSRTRVKTRPSGFIIAAVVVVAEKQRIHCVRHGWYIYSLLWFRAVQNNTTLYLRPFKRYWSSVPVGIIPVRRPNLGIAYVSIFPLSLSYSLIVRRMITRVLLSTNPVFGVSDLLFASFYSHYPFMPHLLSCSTIYSPTLLLMCLGLLSRMRGWLRTGAYQLTRAYQEFIII